MATTELRRTIAIVRTFCGAQEARLFAILDASGVAKPRYTWRAGTLQPYSPEAIGSGEITATTEAKAIRAFQDLVTTLRIIPRPAATDRPVSPHLVQVLPKLDEENCPVEFRPPVGRAKLVRRDLVTHASTEARLECRV